MSVRAVVLRCGRTSAGPQAHRVDDKLHESAKALDRRCSGGHRHCNIFSGGPHTMRIIERYSFRHVNAVLKALRQEVKKRVPVGRLDSTFDEPDVWLTSPQYYEEIYDAITGVRLDPALVAKARNTEMRFLLDELNAYKYDSVDNCLETTGKRMIPVKWVDVNRGGRTTPGSELFEEDNAQTFSATPPYEALWLLVSFAMSPRDTDEKKPRADVYRHYACTPAVYHAATVVGTATGG